MGSGKFQWFCLTAVVAMATSALSAAEFAVPADGPVAFRRDQIPLEREAIANLSKSLVVLAQELDKSTALKRRTAAQMLALAIALDPKNKLAGDVVSRFQINLVTPRDTKNPEQTSDSLKQVWQLLAWLEAPEASNQGLALAACLRDVMVVCDPEHSPVNEPSAAREQGAWQGWVPPLAAYEAPPPVVTVKPKPIVAPVFLLAQTQVHTVAWQNIGKGTDIKWTQAPIRLQMHAEMHVAATAFEIKLAPALERIDADHLIPLLFELFKREPSMLPPKGIVSITSPDLLDPADAPNRQPISAAVAVLVSAALSGCEPDAMILGEVSADGTFGLPPDFWSQIKALVGIGEGRRLVLPTTAAKYLPSLLVLGKEKFFFDYEVLLAADFQELLKLSAKTPDELTRNSMVSFKTIRDKLGTRSVDEYVANSMVRRRLKEISKNFPNHFSSKMLVDKGSGNRPNDLPPKVLASELRLAIEPMAWLAHRAVMEFSATEVEELHASWELCFDQVKSLERYSEIKGDLLVERVAKLVENLRTLDRAVWRGTAYEKFIENYQNIVREINIIIGDDTANTRLE